MIRQEKNITSDLEHRYKMLREHTLSKFSYALKESLVDEMLIPYLLKYNKLKNTYTTSSCAGRILVLGLGTEEKKEPDLFVGKWHRTVKLYEILNALENNEHDELWLKQEPFILHVVAKDLSIAQRILKAKAESGIKRGGILNLKDGRIVIEILGSSYLSVPVKINGKVLFNKKQIGVLVKKSNIKVKRNYKQMWKFLNNLYKEMKNNK